DFFRFSLIDREYIEKNIKILKCYNQSSESLLTIDPTQIRQAFMNIILNSIESIANSGSLSINIIEYSGNKIQILFKDTGSGICKPDLLRIFDPFFTKKDKGTGLGLSITKTIIDNHKGKIYANSDGKNGSEFIIELPLKSKL
ncbi:MAG: two-component sensor histidine kinase, partial [Candidatus Omnitrophica bacterium]|nr:two-component sensor histidine kinase [Candidatus Omnitrophota bacterium]